MLAEREVYEKMDYLEKQYLLKYNGILLKITDELLVILKKEGKEKCLNKLNEIICKYVNKQTIDCVFIEAKFILIIAFNLYNIRELLNDNGVDGVDDVEKIIQNAVQLEIRNEIDFRECKELIELDLIEFKKDLTKDIHRAEVSLICEEKNKNYRENIR